MSNAFLLDGATVPFEDGETVLAAARKAGHFIPHLCWDERFPPHGSCKLCVVKIDGRQVSACATPARDGENVRTLRIKSLLGTGTHGGIAHQLPGSHDG